MIEVAICGSGEDWRVQRSGEVLLRSDSQERAIKFALGWASRSFERGERAQVVYRPDSALPETLAEFQRA